MRYAKVISSVLIIGILGSIIAFAYFFRFSSLPSTTNSVDFRYDSIRSKLLHEREYENYDTLLLDQYPLPHKEKEIHKGVDIKTPLVVVPVSNKVIIPVAKSTLMDKTYIAYNWKLYKKVGINVKKGLYEGELLSKGDQITICTYPLTFDKGLAVIRGCFLEFIEKKDNCTVVSIK